MADKKERIVWIDQLRGIAFFLVILGHILPPKRELNIWIYSFHMPLFFMISGLNLDLKKLTETKFLPFLKRNVERLLVPYFWLMTSMIIFRYFADYKKAGSSYVSDYLLGALVGNNAILDFASIPMYFVLLLFLSQLALWVIAKITSGRIERMLGIAFLLLPITIMTQRDDLIWHVNVLPTAIAFILAGRVIMDFYNSDKEKIQKLKLPLFIAICAGFIIFGNIIQEYNKRVSLNLNFMGKDYTTYFASAVLTSLAFILLSTKLPRIKPLTFIGQNTLFFLGIHEPMMYPVEKYYPELMKNPWTVAALAVTFYILPMPIVWLFNKYMPYFNGRSITELTLPIKIAKVFAVMFALSPVYASLMRFNFAEFIAENKLFIPLSVVVYIAASLAIERLFSLLLPFMFCQNVAKKKVKDEPLPVLEEKEVKTVCVDMVSEEIEEVIIPIEQE